MQDPIVVTDPRPGQSMYPSHAAMNNPSSQNDKCLLSDEWLLSVTCEVASLLVASLCSEVAS